MNKKKKGEKEKNTNGRNKKEKRILKKGFNKVKKTKE